MGENESWRIPCGVVPAVGTPWHIIGDDMKNVVLAVVFVVGCALASVCDAQLFGSRSGDRANNRNRRGVQDWASSKGWQQRGLINVHVGRTRLNSMQDSPGGSFMVNDCADGRCDGVIGKNYTVRKSLPFIPYKSTQSGLWCHPCHGCPPDGRRWVFVCDRRCWVLEFVPDAGTPKE